MEVISMYDKLIPRIQHRLVVIAISISAISLACVDPLLAQDPAAEAVKQFNERVQQYADLHEREVRSAGPKQTEDPALILRQEKQIQDGIRAARQGASQGDIFIPAMRPIILDIIRRELFSKDGARARAVILSDGNPHSAGAVPFQLAVNVPYPSASSLSSVPPSLLLRLPPLPEALEYRFVGRNLILRDTKANLIVDILPSAIP